jgi:hypothetical protein
MRRAEVVESGCDDAHIELFSDPLPNDPEQSADIRASLVVGVEEGIP